jgi:hypothetical protein
MRAADINELCSKLRDYDGDIAVEAFDPTEECFAPVIMAVIERNGRRVLRIVGFDHGCL